MTAIGINAMAFEGRAGSFVSVTASQITVTESSNFENVFSQKMQTSKNQNQDRTVTSIKPQTTEYSKEQATTQQAEDAKNIENQSVTQTEDTQVSEVENTEKVEPEKQTEGIAFEEEVTEEELTQAIEVLNTLMQGIANILGINVEELQGKLEELGIEPGELIDTNKLAQLVLSLNGGEDMSDMLMNNEMLEAFNDIREFVGTVLEDNGLSAENFERITDSDLFTEFMSNEVVKDSEGLFRKPVTESKQNNMQNTVEGEENLAVSDENEGFTVEVNRTGDSEDNRKSNTDSTEGRSESTSTKAGKIETPAETFVKGIENAVGKLDPDMQIPDTQVTVRDVVFQLVDAVKVNISPENTSLEMSLNPESLGHVSLNITSKNGVMTAQIVTENEVSKEALESQLQILKDNIEAQGVRVDAIEVTVSSYIFSDSKNAETDSDNEHSNGGRHSKGMNAGDGETITSESEAERLQHEVMLQNGGTVDYVA